MSEARYTECPICNKVFKKVMNHQKYCCNECSDIAKKAKEKNYQKGFWLDYNGVDIKCQFCGTRFKRTSGNQRFCSRSCREKMARGTKALRYTNTIDQTEKEMREAGFTGTYGQWQAMKYMENAR